MQHFLAQCSDYYETDSFVGTVMYLTNWKGLITDIVAIEVMSLNRL